MVVGDHQHQAKHRAIVFGAGAENLVPRYQIIFLVQWVVVALQQLVEVIHQHIMSEVQHRLVGITSVRIRIFQMMMIMRKFHCRIQTESINLKLEVNDLVISLFNNLFSSFKWSTLLIKDTCDETSHYKQYLS